MRSLLLCLVAGAAVATYASAAADHVGAVAKDIRVLTTRGDGNAPHPSPASPGAKHPRALVTDDGGGYPPRPSPPPPAQGSERLSVLVADDGGGYPPRPTPPPVSQP